MSSTSNTTHTQSSHRLWEKCHRQGGKKCGNWSALNIAAMVLAFVIFWPIGLLVLFSNMSGRDVRDLPQWIRELWAGMKAGCSWSNGYRGSSYSENEVFNEYQQTQYDRIDEIAEEIKARAKRFREFRDNLKRRAQEDEFNHFMADNPQGRNQ